MFLRLYSFGKKKINKMETNVIEGNPTKKFFIEMITRDISIEDAIIDLLDNSIDGANRLKDNDFNGLTINIHIDNTSFCIEDNCGGFSLEVAQKYAFRFGRPDEAPKSYNSVGRFGIGMKRSLFKIGKEFTVESQSQNDHFRVTVNVDDWSLKKRKVRTTEADEIEIDDWSFNYQIVDESLDCDGTRIEVKNLNNDVASLFGDDSFLVNLSENIERLLNFSLLKGLTIILNGKILRGKPVDILMSDTTLPYYTVGAFANVQYKIIAGLGEIGVPKNSGWYIYCNDRLVLEADTSSITGWGVGAVPKWHIDYVMFRGIVFLDSRETLNLPLTTTKKGIDATSGIYKAILPMMINAMIKVLSFLKQIPKMRDEANNYRQTLCENLNKVSAVRLKTLTFENHVEKKFLSPPLDSDIIAQKKNNVRVAYDVNKKIADLAKTIAGVKSYKELGKLSFDYYVKMEDIPNEESIND